MNSWCCSNTLEMTSSFDSPPGGGGGGGCEAPLHVAMFVSGLALLESAGMMHVL